MVAAEADSGDWEVAGVSGAVGSRTGVPSARPGCPSARLYHGPGAAEAALAAARAAGARVLEGGSEGGGALRKDDARVLVELLGRTTVRGVEAVVWGPVDEVAPATADVLLKTLEERGPYAPHPYLWAWDLGGVPATVRSRCLAYWAPGRDPRGDPSEGVGRALYAAWRRGDWAALAEDLKEAGRGDLEPVLRATLAELKPGDPAAELYWAAVRPLFDGHPLTLARVLAPLLAARAAWSAREAP